MPALGIMQGRLLPRYLNRYQAHPLGYWQAEFHIAQELGFEAIEWIIDLNDIQKNPLLSEVGIKEVQTHITQTGIAVRSICADFLMEAPLHSLHQAASEAYLTQIFPLAQQLGITDLIIPCVDQSKLQSEADQTQLHRSLEKLLPAAHRCEITLNLETDLAPQPFLKLIQSQAHPNLAINYDTGNSAALGFDPEEELTLYGHCISIIHIKDRRLNGGSVKLGTGSTQFAPITHFIRQSPKNHIITMQASRQQDYLADLIGVQTQKQFIQETILCPH